MTILQYCSVCKTEYDMAVVPTTDGDDDGVVWLQCPNCKGFLPKVSSSLALRGGIRARAESAGGDDAAEPIAPDVFTAEDDDAAEPSHATLPAATAATASGGDDAADPVADLDFEKAVPYRPWQTYAVGDVIHHLAWDDFGLVVGKEVLPGNRRVVKVRFTTAGTVHLIEQDGVGP
ncbi:MAG: hypothetical protein Q7W56_04870 [Candidatus Latescibacteria bacterium]|nr:hypothetical protein [Candidatus Latescibacterota bacterium]